VDEKKIDVFEREIPPTQHTHTHHQVTYTPETMDSLPIDVQTNIWKVYNTQHVIPRLPTHRELWDKRYTDAKLLRRVSGMKKYNVVESVEDVTHDAMMFISAGNGGNDYEVGFDRDDDASVRRGILDFLHSHRGGKDVPNDEKDEHFKLLRELTYQLLFATYDSDESEDDE
tara:strand:+ start:44 stop:556 length:513 start_codon:yes stop_codon:yes gene_type:complete